MKKDPEKSFTFRIISKIVGAVDSAPNDMLLWLRGEGNFPFWIKGAGERTWALILKSLIVLIPIAGVIHANYSDNSVFIIYVAIPVIALMACYFAPSMAAKIENPWSPDTTKGGLVLFAGGILTLVLVVAAAIVMAVIK